MPFLPLGIIKKDNVNTRVTKAGWLFAILTLIIGFAAVNTGNNLLYLILSSMLGVMATSGFMSYVNIKGLKVKIFPPREAYARELSPFRVVIENKKTIPSFVIQIVLSIEETTGEENFFILSSKRRAEKFSWVYLPKRGLYETVTLSIRTSFPFGFTVREKVLVLREELIVYPHIRVLSQLRGERSEEGNIDIGTRKGVSGDFYGLREFRPNDSPKRIYWKAFFRSQEPLIKQFTDDRGIKTTLYLEKGATEEEIEEIASIAVSYLRAGFLVGLLLPDREIPHRKGDLQKRIILRELALF